MRWIDVRQLPWSEVYVETDRLDRLAEAIKGMEVRGAPAIGVAAALGLALVAYHAKVADAQALYRELESAAELLRKTRPTAYNLFWAIDRILAVAKRAVEKSVPVDDVRSAVINEALRIAEEDVRTNMAIGEHGKRLIDDGDTVLTHCNAGSLATAGYGTALGVIRAAWLEGKRIKVMVTETRPLLQGARLTVWELRKDGIPVTLISDGMVGYVMSRGMVNKVIVGADRILLSGHVINKIGTYTISVVAKEHNVPFYVAAPTSTIDPYSKIEDVVIEERDPDEVRTVVGKLYITVKDVDAINPAFDITPPDNVSAIVTERGVARSPYNESLARLLKRS